MFFLGKSRKDTKQGFHSRKESEGDKARFLCPGIAGERGQSKVYPLNSRGKRQSKIALRKPENPPLCAGSAQAIE